MINRIIALSASIFLFFAFFFVIEIKAENSETLREAIQYFKDGQDEEAQKILQSILKDDTENAEATFYLGRIYLNREDGDKLAVKWLEKAVELDETNSSYHFWLGNAYGMKAQEASVFRAPGLAKKVKKHFLRAVELDPDNTDARFGLMQYYLQAPGIMGGDDAEGKKQAEEIKKRDSLLGHRACAIVYEHEEQYDLAEKEYLAAIQEASDSTNSYYMLGFYYQNREEFQKAYDLFEEVLKKNPLDLVALYQIGKTGALSGQNLERAAECLHRYLLMDPGKNMPSLDWAHCRLGTVFQNAGEIDSAKVHFQTAIKLNPDHKEAKKALKTIK